MEDSSASQALARASKQTLIQSIEDCMEQLGAAEVVSAEIRERVADDLGYRVPRTTFEKALGAATGKFIVGKRHVGRGKSPVYYFIPEEYRQGCIASMAGCRKAIRDYVMMQMSPEGAPGPAKILKDLRGIAIPLGMDVAYDTDPENGLVWRITCDGAEVTTIQHHESVKHFLLGVRWARETVAS